jgi:hypothetical protein
VEKLGPSELKRYLAQANHFGAAARGGGTLGADWSVFAVHGDQLGGHDGTVITADSGRATIQVTVLAKRTIKIAMRPVKVRDGKGGWALHSQASFDLGLLKDQMNQIWTPQANIEFKLVSTDPAEIDDAELDKEIKRLGTTRDDFLAKVHVQGFTPMFSKHKAKDADLTFFLVKEVMSKRLDRPRESPSFPAGATPDDEAIAFLGDRMALDPVRQYKHIDTIPGIVPAHEAGHFMGFKGHDPSTGGTLLIGEGGPYLGFGNVSAAQTRQSFNTKYS